MQKPITSLMVVGLLVLAACGTEGEVQPGPITSFDDIAGTPYKRGPSVGHDLYVAHDLYVQFSEDGTLNISTIRDLVEDHPIGIYETRFEGTKIFMTETEGICDDNPEVIYEIHLLENGNLEFVAIEDLCTHRSPEFQAEWEPVP